MTWRRRGGRVCTLEETTSQVGLGWLQFYLIQGCSGRQMPLFHMPRVNVAGHLPSSLTGVALGKCMEAGYKQAAELASHVKSLAT